MNTSLVRNVWFFLASARREKSLSMFFYVHHISYNHLLTVAFTVASIASFSRKENITMSVIDQGRCCT